MSQSFRNRSVNPHNFAMTPRADVPRSAFQKNSTYKTTFDGGALVPVYCEEVLPGDRASVRMTAFARLATPIFPFMDNLHLESFFFFVPMRLVWEHWANFQGERSPNTNSSISYTIPQSTSPVDGYAVNSLHDYFGLPTVGQVAVGEDITHSNIPPRMYNLIYNEWFRDENLINKKVVDVDDGPDSFGDYVLLNRGKRFDYFTQALPFAQKGTAVALPLGTIAPVVASSGVRPTFRDNTTGLVVGALVNANAGVEGVGVQMNAAVGGLLNWETTGLQTDLSAATAATVNQLRLAFATQKLLERDARGGTRYTEIVLSHFGVRSPDARLQRPEYLGGGSSQIAVNPVAQTSSTDITGSDTPIATLAATAQVVSRHGFTYSATEHGYFIGIVNVRADLTYQQGIRRHWNRLTRYDFYMPALAALGEQSVLSKEIFATGEAGDSDAFGYVPRWDEYRHGMSQITGLFRSTVATPLDQWHLAQQFATRPVLDQTFITDLPPIDRVIAIGEAGDGQQFLFDAFFDERWARPLPIYSVPGLGDRF